jgi:hypothetical protein
MQMWLVNARDLHRKENELFDRINSLNAELDALYNEAANIPPQVWEEYWRS